MLFSSTTLLTTITDEDVGGHPVYGSAGGKESLAADAALQVAQGFPGLSLRMIPIKDKKAYVVDDRPSMIALRQLNKTLVRSLSIKMADRDTIIRRLISVLREGVHHHVYKFDLKSFFESVNVNHLCNALRSDANSSRVASLAVERFFSKTSSLGVQGLPRGVPLSATVAEYSMRTFDQAISQSEFVYFYARFVDDIIIVTGARESKASFERLLKKHLPPGLSFNTAKTRFLDLPVDHKAAQGILGKFDFLGYEFELHRTQRDNARIIHRPVEVRISRKKLARMKARICRSFLAFIQDRDASLLERRLQMLSGNFNVRDLKTGVNRNVGLFCNYRRVTKHEDLKELDRLLHAIAAGNKGKIAKGVAATMTTKERRGLLKYDFQRSFTRRTFYNFSVKELAALRRCWQHV